MQLNIDYNYSILKDLRFEKFMKGKYNINGKAVGKFKRVAR